jgi:hypothetical protein
LAPSRRSSPIFFRNKNKMEKGRVKLGARPSRHTKGSSGPRTTESGNLRACGAAVDKQGGFGLTIGGLLTAPDASYVALRKFGKWNR